MPTSGDPARGASDLVQCAWRSCGHRFAGRLGRRSPRRRPRARLRLPRSCSYRGMTALVVPADRTAEEVVVGCAAATIHGAALAGERLSAGDFYWPRHGRLFAAALEVHASAEEDRVRLCAAGADMPETAVAALLQRRPVMWDTTGYYARRVSDAARRRRLMHICEAAYRRIGEGGTPEEALELLRTAS
jgi:hypothetical protein